MQISRQWSFLYTDSLHPIAMLDGSVPENAAMALPGRLFTWIRLTSDQRDEIGRLLSANRTLMQAYTVKEQLRDVLRAETRAEMELGLKQVLRRTARRANVPMRKLLRVYSSTSMPLPSSAHIIRLQVGSSPSTTTGRPSWVADADIATFGA